MYKTVIKLKSNLDEDVINKIHSLCDNAFDNHAGMLKDKSDDRNILIYEDTNPIGSLCHGIIKVSKMNILQHFESWDFIDIKNGNETCDALEFFKFVKSSKKYI